MHYSTRIPQYIKDYVIKDFKSRSIYAIRNSNYINDKTDYEICSSCFVKLDNHICPKCHHDYRNNVYYDNLEDDVLVSYPRRFNGNKYEFINCIYYYSICKDDVYLYKIRANIRVDVDNKRIIDKYEISNIYSIKHDFVYDLKCMTRFSYKELMNYNERNYIYDRVLLYDTNLDELSSNVLYRNSYLWLISNFANRINSVINIKSLIAFPVKYSNFGLLIRNGYYGLACVNTPDISIKRVTKIALKYGKIINTATITLDELNSMCTSV